MAAVCADCSTVREGQMKTAEDAEDAERSNENKREGGQEEGKRENKKDRDSISLGVPCVLCGEGFGL